MPRRSDMRLDRLELAVGQGAGVVDQPADQGRLAVVDVADDDDLELAGLAGGRAWHAGASHVAGGAQTLERVLGLVVHRAAGALGRPGSSRARR